MNPFGRLHPFAILLYYVMAAVLMVGTSDPFVNLTVWIMSLLHYFFLTGMRKGFRMLWYSLGTAVLCLMVNPLLNHRGVTLLFMLGEWRITKEAVLYGMHMAILLLASLLLFSCFSHHMTAEKIMTLMGKRMPSFALLFSMILRFVPKAGKDFREMAALHGNHPSMWQALLGITLEDAVGRSLSMKSRCYGMKTRSSYYHRKMDRSEILLCVCCVTVTMGLLVCQYMHQYRVRFFPSIHMDRLPLWMWTLFFIFYSLPLVWQGKEELSWYLSRRKITDSVTRRKNSQQSISGNY